MDVLELNHEVLPLSSNRVWRIYTGGYELEKWQGLASPKDSELPEEWIASIVRARNSGCEGKPDEGLSRIRFADFDGMTLKELIESILKCT